MWNASPDLLIGSAFVFPSGHARVAEGGYVLSGRWPFSSGIDPSHWNLVGGIVRDERDRPLEHRIFLVQAKDYRIVDTWFVAGLRATGSKDVEMGEVFVPAHRTLALARGRRRHHAGQRGQSRRALQAAGAGIVLVRGRRGIARHRPRSDHGLSRRDARADRRLYRSAARRPRRRAAPPRRGGRRSPTSPRR